VFGGAAADWGSVVASNEPEHRYPPQLVDALRRALESQPDLPPNTVVQVSSRVLGEETIVVKDDDR
jgi:hypothetical protein